MAKPILSTKAEATLKTIRGIASLKTHHIPIAQSNTFTVFRVSGSMYPDFDVKIEDNNELPSSQFTYDFDSATSTNQDVALTPDFKSILDINYPLTIAGDNVVQITHSHIVYLKGSRYSEPVHYSAKIIKALMTKLKVKPKDLINLSVTEAGALRVSSKGGSITLQPELDPKFKRSLSLCSNFLLNGTPAEIPVNVEPVTKTDFEKLTIIH